VITRFRSTTLDYSSDHLLDLVKSPGDILGRVHGVFALTKLPRSSCGRPASFAPR
jgi:hypothetical protein